MFHSDDDLIAVMRARSYLPPTKRSWRSYLDKPNDALPGVPQRPPAGWTTQYGRDFSPSRRPPIQTPTRRIVGYSKWADAAGAAHVQSSYDP
jgi:hypothetical protein